MDENNDDLIVLTADIVSSYVANNAIQSDGISGRPRGSRDPADDRSFQDPRWIFGREGCYVGNGRRSRHYPKDNLACPPAQAWPYA